MEINPQAGVSALGSRRIWCKHWEKKVRFLNFWQVFNTDKGSCGHISGVGFWMPWSRRALASAVRYPKHMNSSPEMPHTPHCRDVPPLLQGYLLLPFFLHKVSYPEAAQTLLWTHHGGSLYQEGHLGLRKLRNPALSHQQCRRQLHSLPLLHGYSEV